MTPAERKFKETIVDLLFASVYPSPNAIRKALGRPSHSDRNGGDVLNGRETRWRRQILNELGWTERQIVSGKPMRRFAWTAPA